MVSLCIALKTINMSSIPVLKNVHINKGYGFVAAYTVVKLLACTQTSFSFSFRQQSRIQERARSSRKKKKERLYCGHLWVKRGLLSPSHGNFVSFCWLLSPPLPPCATFARRSLKEKIEGLWTAIKLHNMVNTFILKLKQAKSAACWY